MEQFRRLKGGFQCYRWIDRVNRVYWRIIYDLDVRFTAKLATCVFAAHHVARYVCQPFQRLYASHDNTLMEVSCCTPLSEYSTGNVYALALSLAINTGCRVLKGKRIMPFHAATVLSISQTPCPQLFENRAS